MFKKNYYKLSISKSISRTENVFWNI